MRGVLRPNGEEPLDRPIRGYVSEKVTFQLAPEVESQPTNMQGKGRRLPCGRGGLFVSWKVQV